MNSGPGSETFGLPVNEAVAFSTPKGKVKESIKKNQLRMLEKYAAILRQFLEPGEEILLVMRGCSPMSLLEQLTTGWIIVHIKRCAFVVTNRRILHFPAQSNYAPRHSISQIRYGDVDAIKASAFLGRKFSVSYKDGSKETFYYVQESRKLKAILDGFRIAGEQPSPVRARHHLCPKCTAPLSTGTYTCSKCGLEFKSEKKARVLSILLPGGGYFYTGHPFLGISDAIGETILLALVASSLYGILFGTSDPAGKIMVFFVFSLLFAVEKLITIYHARHYVREYIPVDKDFHPINGLEK